MGGKSTMADYKNMYQRLFNAVTDSINILQKAQLDTEDTFISAEEAKIVLLNSKNNKDDDGEGDS
jgi:hypothetical protein